MAEEWAWALPFRGSEQQWGGIMHNWSMLKMRRACFTPELTQWVSPTKVPRVDSDLLKVVGHPHGDGGGEMAVGHERDVVADIHGAGEGGRDRDRREGPLK